MGEKPVLNVQAHVFQIDPETKRKWLPSSSSSVRVAYYHDPNRKTYRIIAIESGKALVNSTVTANMTFTKTSPKFGQWSDHRANTVFGLGFASEKDLSLFADKFSEAKTAAKALLEERKKMKTRDFVQPPAGSKKDTSEVKSFPPDNNSEKYNEETSQNGNISDPISSPPTSSSSPSSSPTITSVTATVSLPPTTVTTTSVVNGSDKHNDEKHLSFEQQIESLKFENSKLKVALASSAQNVKKWESEMQTLRNNNAMLTTALEESTQHVAEWKRQLQKYKEECDQLKKKVTEMEREKSEFVNPEEVSQIKKENEELKEVLSEVQVDLEMKREEVQKKEDSLYEMKENLRETEQERNKLKLRNSELDEHVKTTTASYKQKLTTLKDQHRQLGIQLSSVVTLHKDLFGQLEEQ